MPVPPCGFSSLSFGPGLCVVLECCFVGSAAAAGGGGGGGGRRPPPPPPPPPRWIPHHGEAQANRTHPTVATLTRFRTSAPGITHACLQPAYASTLPSPRRAATSYRGRTRPRLFRPCTQTHVIARTHVNKCTHTHTHTCLSHTQTRTRTYHTQTRATRNTRLRITARSIIHSLHTVLSYSGI